MVKMGHPINLFVVTILIFFFFSHQAKAVASATYNVLSLGAKPDGETDSTKALMTAWAAACGSPKPASVYVPAGRFLVGQQAKFFGPCKNSAITFRIDGTLVAPSDYKVLGHADNWLHFQNVDGVSIVNGILEAQGTSLWDCKNSGKNCPRGATSLRFSESNNIAISGLTSLNSQIFHIVFHGCNNVKLEGIKVSAAGDSPNTDGIHVQLSSGVTILNSKLSTGDDCVSVGPGTTNLWIQDVICGPGHGISIGSLGKEYEEKGVQNVTVTGVTFINTQNGVRIKSWARPSTGFVKGVLFQDVVMINAKNPILIDQTYCPHHKNCPGQVSGVQINDVTYQGIHGTSASEVAVRFDCSQKNPCTRITLEDVKLTYKDEPAQSSCANADGTSRGFIEPSSCLV